MSKALPILFALCLLPLVAHTQPGAISEPPDIDYGISGAFRIVGCTPPRNALTITARRAGQPQIAAIDVLMIQDERGITTAYFTFTGLVEGSYRVSVSVSDPSCLGGRWLGGGRSKILTIKKKVKPFPSVAFLYVTQEKETTLDMTGFIGATIKSFLVDAHPTLHLNNHGPEHDNSRWLEGGSWFRYTDYWTSPGTIVNKEIRFSIPEIRKEVENGALGVFKYYVNN